MIIFNELQEKVDRIHGLVDSFAFYRDIDSDYDEGEIEIYNLFGYDASQIIAILNSLDFNDKELQYWLFRKRGFSCIVQHLPTFSQKFLVIEHFRELRKSFPDKGFNEDLDYVINLAEEFARYFS